MEFIDWDRFLTEETFDEPNWALFPFVEFGQVCSFYSPPGAGKSLLMLELICRLVHSGVDLAGWEMGTEPIFYFDHENSKEDIRNRIDSFGLSPISEEEPFPDLGMLQYARFPDFPPLDTERGGEALLETITKSPFRRPARLVVFDTIKHFLEGEENSADTWSNFYKYTLMPLKRLEIGVILLDHSGKEVDRGERGSSAKRSYIDTSYELKVNKAGTRRTLIRHKTRNGNAPEEVVFDVYRNPTRHVISSKPASKEIQEQPSSKVEALIEAIEDLDLPRTYGFRRISPILRETGVSFRDADLTKAIKEWKSRMPDDEEKAHPGTHPGTHLERVPDAGTHSPAAETKEQVEAYAQDSWHTRAHTGTHPLGGDVCPPSATRKGAGGAHTQSDELKQRRLQIEQEWEEFVESEAKEQLR